MPSIANAAASVGTVATTAFTPGIAAGTGAGATVDGMFLTFMADFMASMEAGFGKSADGGDSDTAEPSAPASDAQPGFNPISAALLPLLALQDPTQAAATSPDAPGAEAAAVAGVAIGPSASPPAGPATAAMAMPLAAAPSPTAETAPTAGVESASPVIGAAEPAATAGASATATMLAAAPGPVAPRPDLAAADTAATVADAARRGPAAPSPSPAEGRPDLGAPDALVSLKSTTLPASGQPETATPAAAPVPAATPAHATTAGAAGTVATVAGRGAGAASAKAPAPVSTQGGPTAADAMTATATGPVDAKATDAVVDETASDLADGLPVERTATPTVGKSGSGPAAAHVTTPSQADTGVDPAAAAVAALAVETARRDDEEPAEGDLSVGGVGEPSPLAHAARSGEAASTARTEAPAAQTTAQPVNEQIAGALASHAARGDKRFEIRLDPAELGRVDVRLEINSVGEVKAHLIVERTETLDMMLRDQRQLERSLEQAGMKLGEGGVSVSLRQDGGGRQQAWRPSWQEDASSGRGTADAADPLTVAARPVYGRPARPTGIDLKV